MAKTQFYIDRQFGHAIFLDVEDGIFTGCPHTGKMETGIEKKYKGKTISEVKELFEKAFEGASFVCVHSLDYTTLMQNHEAHETRMAHNRGKMNENHVSKEEIERLTKSNERERSEQYQVELKLRDVYDTLKDIHGFVFYEKKFDDLVGVAK